MIKDNEKIPTKDLTPDVQVLMQKKKKPTKIDNVSPPKCSNSTAIVSKMSQTIPQNRNGRNATKLFFSSYKDIINKENLLTNSPA